MQATQQRHAGSDRSGSTTLVTLAIAVTMLGACSTGDATAPAQDVTNSPSQTATAAPTAPTSTPTPDDEPTAATVAHRYDDLTGTPDLGAPGGPSGSECSPGPGPLPDGVWFGFALGFQDGAISFDLACWWDGDEAEEEFGEYPPNDYEVTNDSDVLRDVTVSADAVAYVVQQDITLSPATLAAWATTDGDHWGDCPGEWCMVWLYVNDGVVTEIQEVWVP